MPRLHCRSLSLSGSVDAANDRCPEVPFGPDICIRKWRDKIHWIDFNILGEEAESEIARTEKIYPNQSLELRFPNGVLSLNTLEILEEVSVFFGVTHRSVSFGTKASVKEYQTARADAWSPSLAPKTDTTDSGF